MALLKQKTNNSSNFTKGNIQSGLYVIAFIGFIIFATFAATENYSQGERIGFITKFSFKGRFWKSWEEKIVDDRQRMKKTTQMQIS